MIEHITSTTHLILPALTANLAPVLAKHLPFNHPLDFKLTHAGIRLLGNNKTIGGLFLGLTASTLTAYLQSILYPTAFSTNWFAFGITLGLGALLGDVIKSYFKRQHHIKPGTPWIPFDQIDYGIGTIIALRFFTPLPLSDIFLIILLCGTLHITTTITGYLLNLKPTPW